MAANFVPEAHTYPSHSSLTAISPRIRHDSCPHLVHVPYVPYMPCSRSGPSFRAWTGMRPGAPSGTHPLCPWSGAGLCSRLRSGVWLCFSSAFWSGAETDPAPACGPCARLTSPGLFAVQCESGRMREVRHATERPVVLDEHGSGLLRPAMLLYRPPVRSRVRVTGIEIGGRGPTNASDQGSSMHSANHGPNMGHLWVQYWPNAVATPIGCIYN